MTLAVGGTLNPNQPTNLTLIGYLFNNRYRSNYIFEYLNKKWFVFIYFLFGSVVAIFQVVHEMKAPTNFVVPHCLKRYK